MFNIQSPNFSSCSKIDIASKLSPMFRNRRIASGQQLAPNHHACHWNRTNSCKKLQSPSNQKHRKRSHNSQQRVCRSKINISHNLIPSNSMFQQLNTLKNEYTTIKIAYKQLIDNKIKNDEENKKYKTEINNLKEQNQRIKRDNQKLRNKVMFLEAEVDRIKRESMKLIQIEQFKALKLEENLVEKQKAISNLIESLKIEPSNIDMTPIATTQSEPIPCSYPQPLTLCNPHIESLTFSQDKTLSNSQFISISLTSMMQNQSQYRHELSTRRNIGGLINVINSQNQMSKNGNDQNNGINNNISIIEHASQKVYQSPSANSNANNGNNVNIVNYLSGKQNENKVSDTFKKFRKEISKKIEVNVEDRGKDSIPQHKNMNTNINSNSNSNSHGNGNGNGLDRKNSKSHKSSKAKLKRDEQSSEHRSSKKKIVNK